MVLVKLVVVLLVLVVVVVVAVVPAALVVVVVVVVVVPVVVEVVLLVLVVVVVVVIVQEVVVELANVLVVVVVVPVVALAVVVELVDVVVVEVVEVLMEGQECRRTCHRGSRARRERGAIDAKQTPPPSIADVHQDQRDEADSEATDPRHRGANVYHTCLPRGSTPSMQTAMMEKRRSSKPERNSDAGEEHEGIRHDVNHGTAYKVGVPEEVRQEQQHACAADQHPEEVS